jgi:hypothetical protein
MILRFLLIFGAIFDTFLWMGILKFPIIYHLIGFLLIIAIMLPGLLSEKKLK